MSESAPTSRELWPISNLQIVGYANVLTQTMLPSVVAPIFSNGVDGAILLPPFTISENYVSNPIVSTRAELEELADRQEVTLLENPFAAQPNYELWVDHEFKPHYELHVLADQKLREISREHARKARALIRDKKLLQATEALRVAQSADDRWVDPYILEGVIAQLSADPTGLAIAKNAAARSISDSSFDRLLESELQSFNGKSQSISAEARVSTPPHRPMQEIAVIKPEEQPLAA